MSLPALGAPEAAFARTDIPSSKTFHTRCKLRNFAGEFLCIAGVHNKAR
jgi:hypothetical protein